MATYNETATGGVRLAGLGITLRICRPQPSGGIVVSGTSQVTFIDYVDGTGGVRAAGLSNNNHMRFFRYAASGGAIVRGEADAGIENWFYTSIGSVDMGGEAEYRFAFHRNLTVLFNTNNSITSDATFLWNTGRLFSFWYRIVGKNKCSQDPCCQRYIVNVHARSLSELCEKLTARRYRLVIEDVQKFRMPADNADVASAEADGEEFDCNEFEPIELCTIPKCAEFCVAHDVVVEFNFDIFRVQVDAFFDHEASGEIFLSGAAPVSYEQFIPDFPHEASGGITMGGDADYTSSGYIFEGSGGIVMGGVSGIRSSVWEYVGGLWPSTTKQHAPAETESLLEDEEDQVWSLTERVKSNNNMFCSTDISYGRTSEFLIVRELTLNIPEDQEILHVYVTVERKSNQTGVRDLEAYLLVGDEIISGNEAKVGVDWPYLVEATTVYDFEGPFDVDELNDTTFGFALRITAAVNSTPATIASVDYISVEVTFEDADHNRIRMAGEAGIVSSAYSWQASGGIVTDGAAYSRSGRRYIASGGAIITGVAGFGYDYETEGGVVTMGGSADCRPSFQELEGSGGVRLGGAADVKPYMEFGTAGVKAGGSARVRTIYRTSGAGGVEYGGSANVPEAVHHWDATGGISMGGVADRTTEHWSHVASGSIVFGSTSIIRPSDFGTLMTDVEFNMTVDSMVIQFGEDEHVGDAVGVTDLVNRCGCGDIPMQLNMEQNIVRNNNFSQFLVRNGLTMERRMRLFYNVPNDSWQANLHYRGLSADGNTEETWDIVFDVQCTQNLGGIFIGRQIWKFGMEMVRRNLTTGDDYDTRIVVGVLPDEICGANELNFSVRLDTQDGLAEVTPDATIYQTALFDNVGLFKNPAWILNPDAIFTVSQIGLDAVQPRIDLRQQVLVDR